MCLQVTLFLIDIFSKMSWAPRYFAYDDMCNLHPFMTKAAERVAHDSQHPIHRVVSMIPMVDPLHFAG